MRQLPGEKARRLLLPEGGVTDTRSTPPSDFYALLAEFEKLVLDANDNQLPRHAQLPVSKRLNEVRAKLQVLGARSESAAIVALRAELEQERDIRSTREITLSLVADGLGVEHEPHQTFDERLLEASCTPPALALLKEARPYLDIIREPTMVVTKCDAEALAKRIDAFMGEHA